MERLMPGGMPRRSFDDGAGRQAPGAVDHLRQSGVEHRLDAALEHAEVVVPDRMAIAPRAPALDFRLLQDIAGVGKRRNPAAGAQPGVQPQ